METNRIRQYCILYEIQNLRKASEMLGLSHGALFKSLRVLQEDLGQKLYIQEGRGLTMTDFGHKFYMKAQTFLEHEKELLNEAKDQSKTFRIGTFEVFSTHLLGNAWTKYFKTDTLDLYEMLPGFLERSLMDNKIDIGITYEPVPTAGVEFTQIGKVEMGIFARSGHLIEQNILKIPFVSPVTPLEGIPSGVQGLDGWPEDKFPRNIQYRVDMMESGLALARLGQAAIFIPKFVARHHNRMILPEYHLTERKLPQGMKPVQRSVYLLKRKSRVEDTFERSIAKLIRNECLDN